MPRSSTTLSTRCVSRCVDQWGRLGSARATQLQYFSCPDSFSILSSQPTSFDKKSYMVYLKDYMKALKADLQSKGKSEDEIKAFEKGAQGLAKKILGNFKVSLQCAQGV